MIAEYVNGEMVYREMTDDEVNEIKKQNQQEMLNELLKDEITNADLIAIVLANINVTTPAGDSISAVDAVGMEIDLPFKAGHRWERIVSDTGIGYRQVEDPDAIGSESNPIIYGDGVQMISGAYYLIDGKRHINMDGQMVEW